MRLLYFNPLFVSPSNHKYDMSGLRLCGSTLWKDRLEDGGETACTEGAKDNTRATKYHAASRQICAIWKRAIELFAQACGRNAQKRDEDVILDGVFNHCGSFNKWMDRERIYEQSRKVMQKGHM